MKPKFTFVTNHDDWEGLYMDDNLVEEGHTIALQWVVSHLNNGYSEWKQLVVEGEWLYDEGALPPTLTELLEKENRNEV